MKTCPSCDETKPISAFYRNAKRNDGLAGWCTICEIRAGKASALKFRLQVIEHLGGSCARCGYSNPGPELQIDHVNGDGRAERTAPGGAGPRSILRAALADTEGRYQLLCANCNQIKRIENREHKGNRVYTRRVPDGEGTKWCARCKTTKHVREFHRNKARHDGLSVYCSICTTKRTHDDIQRLRRAAIDGLGGRCMSCQYDTDYRALQIDHVNGDAPEDKKNRNILGALYRSIIADQTGKYQVLCANCNLIKRMTSGEHRKRGTYVHNPATERRPTRKYLTSDQIAEVARLVAVEGLLQSEVAARFGIDQTVVSVHTRNRYPSYRGSRSPRRVTKSLPSV